MLCTIAIGVVASCADAEDAADVDAFGIAGQDLEELDVKLDDEWSLREIFDVLHDHKSSTGRAAVIGRDRDAAISGRFMIAFALRLPSGERGPPCRSGNWKGTA